MAVYRVDIDNTICTCPSPGDYMNARPVSGWIDKINALYDAGNELIYWTSRGVATGKPWFTETKKQLYMWGCKHHELLMDKPEYDHIIDDKSSRIEELPNLHKMNCDYEKCITDKETCHECVRNSNYKDLFKY